MFFLWTLNCSRKILNQVTRNITNVSQHETFALTHSKIQTGKNDFPVNWWEKSSSLRKKTVAAALNIHPLGEDSTGNKLGFRAQHTLKSLENFTIKAHFHGGKPLNAVMTDEALAEVGIVEKPQEIFDRQLKRQQRNRAAFLTDSQDPILQVVTECLLDRLEDCRKEFPVCLGLGGALENIRRQLGKRGGVKKLFAMDMSPDMVDFVKKNSIQESVSTDNSVEFIPLIGDEEFLPFKDGSLDVIISSLGLHWVNDVPGALTQCRRALKPDGLFLGAMFGGDTLKELRIACTIAQQEREGGISPRVSPLAQVRDAGNLLTRAGFSLPTVDIDTYAVKYPSALELVDHLRSMGETNAVLQRNLGLRRDTALATAAVYQSMFGDEDGNVPATFQVIFMAGWSPHSSHQKAKERGSAPLSMKELKQALEKKSR